MEINEDDKKLLEMLGLENIPDQEKQIILEEIDQKMSERFIANLLTSLDDEASKKLQAELDAMPNDDPSAIIDKIIKTHPDAASILEKTSQEVMEEFKKAREKKLDEPSEGQSSINLDNKPPIEQAAPKEPDMPSGSSLSNVSESELDKNIDEDEEDENMPTSAAPEPPAMAEKSEENAIELPKEEKPQETLSSGVVKSEILPTPSAEEKPLDVNFSPTNSEEAITSPEPPQPEVAEPAPVESAPAEPIFAEPAPIEPTPPAPAPAPAPAQESPEVTPISSPTENPAPWSFSSTPVATGDQPKSQQDETPAAPIAPEQNIPEAPQDNSASPAPTPPTPPTNPADSPQSQASSIADLYK